MANLQLQNTAQKPFIPNSKIPFSLGLGGKIRRGVVVLTGQIVVSAGTTSGTAYKEGGPAEFISRIKVIANPAGGSRYPGGNIVDCDVRSLLRNAMWQRSGKYIGDLNGGTLGNGAAGTYQIYLPIPIYFADATQRNRPIATSLNTDQGVYASVQVEVSTGSLSSCFTGNDRTVDYSGLQIMWMEDRIGLPGDTVVLYQESHELFIAASNKRMADEGMPQDGSFLSWQFCAQAGAQRVLSEALLNRVVIGGPTLKFDKFAMDIREAMIADEWMDPSQTPTGLYYIDYTDGVIEANNVGAFGLTTYFDVNNVSGANLDQLDVFTRRIQAPLPASK